MNILCVQYRVLLRLIEVAMEQCCASCFFSSSESRRQPNSYLFFEFWRKRLKFPLKKVGGGGDNKNPNTKYEKRKGGSMHNYSIYFMCRSHFPKK